MLAPVPKKDRVAPAANGDLPDQNELLPMEEIYIAAGIVNPRRGYTIKKVVEMLHSEHLGALSKEMRRASVMMALPGFPSMRCCGTHRCAWRPSILTKWSRNRSARQSGPARRKSTFN
jgi:hypothetical protein